MYPQFVGQMYTPGAVEERLTMGILEGLLHREYVEGMDEDYATFGLTATDCSFNRFKTVRLRCPDLIAAKSLLQGVCWTIKGVCWTVTGFVGTSQLTISRTPLFRPHTPPLTELWRKLWSVLFARMNVG
jgi:hypothetical protein